MSRIRPVKAALLSLSVVVALAIYFLFFHWRTTAHSFSISPDGTYTCEVVEKYRPEQSEAFVTIRKRVELEGRADEWQVVLDDRIYNDSMTQPYYSINWRYGADYRTEAVEIFTGGSSLSQPTREYELSNGQWWKPSMQSRRAATTRPLALPATISAEPDDGVH